MKNIATCLCLLGLLLGAAPARGQFLDNPLVKGAIKFFIQDLLPKVSGMDPKAKIGDLDFLKIKHGKGFYKIKGVLLPDNKATRWLVGKGDTRFKLKIGDSLLPPKFYWLKIHIPRLRILGIRFYVKVF